MESMAVNVYKISYEIYIGRGSKWGNPFEMKNKSDEERDRVCDAYEEWFFTQDTLVQSLHELKGHKLGCFCKPKRCHGDFLSKLANISTRIRINQGLGYGSFDWTRIKILYIDEDDKTKWERDEII